MRAEPKESGAILLALDIGNSATTAGLFCAARLLASEQAPTEWLARHPRRWLFRLLKSAGIRPSQLEVAAIASVVPWATKAWSLFCRERLGCRPFIITGETATRLVVRYQPARALGADRLVAALAASHFYAPPVICVSLGTATVVDAVSADDEFLGGAILPGIRLCLEALARNTALLPQVEPAPTDSPIGENTISGLRAGAIFGTAAALEGLVRRFRAQLGGRAKVVLTGGYAPLILPHLRGRFFHHPGLALEGIRLAWEYRRSQGK